VGSKQTRFIMLVVGLVASGVGSTCADRSSSPSTTPMALPDEPPSIIGVITAIDAGRVRIEEDPAQSFGSAKAVVRLNVMTRIEGPNGAVWPADSLRVGQRARAWFAGPVAESYPVQTGAAAIAID
jgi:hypothetical protein